jgi:hypothetical protein
MRSEDRKPSKRVFPLLQNLDLDTVTFAQVQGVGDPITIEDMNEQEMVDLIIVNLARLVVAGEWTGLLEAGGGAPGLKIVTSTMSGGAYDQFNIADAPPYGESSATGSMEQVPYVDELFLWPFQAQKTGTVSSLGLKFNSAGAYEVVIYEVDDENLPVTLIVKGTLTASGAETVYQTSLTGFGGGGAGAITVGETYFLGMVRVTDSPQVFCASYLNRNRCAATDAPSSTGGTFLRTPTYNTASGVPDTIDNTQTYPASTACPKATYEVS